MSFDDIFIWVVVLVLLFYAKRLISFFIATSFRLKYMQYEHISKDELECDWLETIKPLEDLVFSQGFEYQYTLKCEGGFEKKNIVYHMLFYYNPDSAVHACITTQPQKSAQEPVKLSYKTIYEDSSSVETLNGQKHFLTGHVKNKEVYDHYFAELEEIYPAHLKDRESKDAKISRETFSREGLIDHVVQDERSQIQAGKDENIIKDTDSGYKFKFSWATWQYAKTSLQGHSKYAKQIKSRISQHTKVLPSTLIDQIKQLQKPQEQINKKSLFAISVIAFVVLFGLLGMDIVKIFFLVIILFVHELGHYLAMRFYGYSDTSIFFLPFGAVTFGDKEYKKAYQEYIVLLAGPLPGILIAIAMFVWSSLYYNISFSGYLMEYALMSLVINYINLLPIYPLDGGKILQLLLLHRYPKGQFYFYVISLGVLISAMVWLRDPILLIFVVIILLGTKQSYKVSQIMSNLYAKYGDNINKVVVAKEILNNEKTANDTLSTQANIGKQILHTTQTSKPSKWFVFVGMAFYLGLVSVPFVAYYAPYLFHKPSGYSKLPKEIKNEVNEF
jgi:Zn-dependent protease